MKHIVYVSQAVRPFTDQDLDELLTQCRRDNARLGITGVLFYSHGRIAQLFEGKVAPVNELFSRIARDGRHTQVRKLLDPCGPQLR